MAGTIAPMHRSLIAKIILGVCGLALAAVLVYQLPPVKERLWWRVDLAATYLRGIIYPANQAPAPRVVTPPPTAKASSALPTPVLHSTSPTRAAPTTAPTATPTLPPLPPKTSLPAPAYEKQDINNCGPATLAMYLHFYGWDGDQFAIDTVVKPLRDDRNVNVEELAYFTHTHAGWLNLEYRVGGTVDRLKRILAAGIPVMIEEAFPLDESYWPNDDRWAGHYLLLTGYDEERQAFISQDSYYGADRPAPYTELDQRWKAYNRVYILVYRPEQEGTVKDLLGADWDPDANRQAALEAAQAETKANPKDAFSWFNVGTNLVYFERYTEAAQAYDTARDLGLPQRMLRYQFGPFIAYFHSGRTQDLLDLVKYALQRTPNSEEALLWYGWTLYREGNTNGAVEQFRKALKANPTYQDAQYALNYLGETP